MIAKKLIVMCAPSGAGKTSICRRLQSRYPEISFSVSATTRARRNGEVDGKDYFFFSDEEFDRKVAAGEFVEWEEVHGRKYGTLRQSLLTAIEHGSELLLDIDVKGGVKIKQQFPDETIAIFIEAPDLETLRERLSDRGTDNAEEIEKRLSRLPVEMSYKDKFDFIVINDDLDIAVDEISNLLRGV